MYTDLMLKLTQQQWQPIEAYPVLFYYTKPNSWLYNLKIHRELSTNIIYKN